MKKKIEEKIKKFVFRLICGDCDIIANYCCSPMSATCNYQTEVKTEE